MLSPRGAPHRFIRTAFLARARMRIAALRIVRPGNAAMSALAVAVAAFVAAGPGAFGDGEPGIDEARAAFASWPFTVGSTGAAVLAGMVAAFAFAGAGNAANDLRDVDVDRVAHPRRPLVAGDLSRREARGLVIVLYAVALAAGAIVSPAGFALVLAALVILEAYEITLKRRGLAGNVAVALVTGAPFLMGGLAVASVSRTLLVLAGLAALSTLGREILKDVEDAGGDALRRRTLPMRVGERAAASIGGGALVLAVALSPAPFLLETLLAWPYLPVVALADAGFLAAAAIARRPRGAARAQRVAKASMLVALVAFVAGKLAAIA